MKNLFLCFVTLIFLGCTHDEATIDNDTKLAVQPLYRSTSTPLNTSNPYDACGQLFDALFELYYFSADSLPTDTDSICSRVELLAHTNAHFLTGKTLKYSPVNATDVNYLQSNPNDILGEVIATISISTVAKDSLKSFVTRLLALHVEENDFDSVYRFITDYENRVQKNPSFSATDKQVMLTSSSIMRYSSFRAKKKPKKNTDPEWDLLIGHVSGAIQGAPNGMSQAATLALATAIVENK